MQFIALLALLLPFPALAVVSGATTTYKSPNGVAEKCVAAHKIPGGVFTPKDEKSEAKLCSFDIYRNEIAACPKTWSTSPGTMLYSAAEAGLSQAEYEASAVCGQKAGHKQKLAKFKTTMNQSGTSGTFSQSSLLYYQFSRYFNTVVQVPVAVYRSFDKDVHYTRISSKAQGLGAMNKAAWEYLRRAAQNPASYSPNRELFTPDLQLYGALLDDGGGERYGTEINGVRSSWGDPQNNDLQKTPAFLALRSEKPFLQALAEGLALGARDVKVKADLGVLSPGPVQMGLWMRELTEITLLDYIFSQQDRVGNIDYNWYWVYSEGGAVKAQKEKRNEYKNLPRRKMKPIAPPAELAAFNPVLVQKSVINDNDAGGRNQYVNYTKRTKMLEKIRHFDAGVYQRLIALKNDYSAKGPLYQHLVGTFYLDAKQIAQVVANTKEAAEILQASCRTGVLRFDLNFDQIVNGDLAEAKVDCGN
jgi:hypothetical protein